MTKIMPEHLARGAFVYVRQSTADQLLHNHESRRRQYGLADRARQLGWQEVAVIDDDLGRSGSGVSRPGFERLLAAICEGRAGAVFAIEASRLARNGRDWHTLIEFCGLVGTIIIDEDGIYEPRHPNDRAEFERNQRLIADNANSKGLMARGAVRRGETLLAGLLRCGHCGRKLHVAYGGTHGEAGRYHCKGSSLNHGGDRCISFGSLRVDQAVGVEIMRLLKPLGIEAALAAIEARKTEAAETRRQLELALTQARYEAALARRQYDAVDPDNRLVAGELERRWNDKLVAVRKLEEEFEAAECQRPAVLGNEERDHLLRLGADLETAWSHPAATMATRKRIVRAVLHEIVVRIEEGFVDLVLHWRGGDRTG